MAKRPGIGDVYRLSALLISLQREEEREGPVQGRLYRSTKLWLFYCDLEESLGTIESTRAVYDKILELRIATPQTILNYALFLQVVPHLIPEQHVPLHSEQAMNTLPFSCIGGS